MTRSALRWFTLRETVIGIAISTLVSTVPAVVLRGASQAEAAQAVPTVAVGLTAQFFMNALMSELVPTIRL